MYFNIEEELKKLPAKPGVYIMHDNHDTIIYVGKAISLKNRVRQYFQSSRNLTPKIQQMVARIQYFEYIITDSELEALVLECNLIKEHRPKYNTMLKDDKSYPYIKVTIQEDFPRVLFARQRGKDKAKYFGPYTSSKAVKDTIELIQKLYLTRTCNRNLPKDIGKERPCLYYHIKQCKAPCQGYISKEEYKESVTQALEFLNGNFAPVLKGLEAKMLEASEKMEFEEAAGYRDLLNSVKQISEKQKITGSEQEDRDVMAVASTGEEAVVQTFFIRNGKLIGREHHYLTNIAGETKNSLITSFIKQFYAGTPYVPRELYVSDSVEEQEILEEWLTAKRGQKVHIKMPVKGEKERLVELARKNASLVLQQDAEKIKREEAKTTGALATLGEMLHIPGLRRIEAFDISNISGFDSVGSMVVYENGKPKRSDYRKFKIKSVIGPDDYASMNEVLTRRFTHGMKEQEELKEKNLGEEYGSFNRYPDLILMDGGKGQVHIALKVLEDLKLNIPVCGMVKDDNHRTRGLLYCDKELPLSASSETFKLITRIQDETHRFAIEFHRSLRGKTQVHSILDDIEGVGTARRRALMKHYQSLADVKAATIEELAAIETMNMRAAKQVYDFFHKEENTIAE